MRTSGPGAAPGTGVVARPALTAVGGGGRVGGGGGGGRRGRGGGGGGGPRSRSWWCRDRGRSCRARTVRRHPHVRSARRPATPPAAAARHQRPRRAGLGRLPTTDREPHLRDAGAPDGATPPRPTRRCSASPPSGAADVGRPGNPARRQPGPWSRRSRQAGVRTDEPAVIVAHWGGGGVVGGGGGGSGESLIRSGGRARIDGSQPSIDRSTMGLDNPLHLAFLLVILLIVFGAKRLPEMGSLAQSRASRLQRNHQRETTAPPLTPTRSSSDPDERPSPAPYAVDEPIMMRRSSRSAHDDQYERGRSSGRAAHAADRVAGRRGRVRGLLLAEPPLLHLINARWRIRPSSRSATVTGRSARRTRSARARGTSPSSSRRRRGARDRARGAAGGRASLARVGASLDHDVTPASAPPRATGR